MNAAIDTISNGRQGGELSASVPAAVAKAPVVLEARGLSKSFRIPEHRVDSFKERAVHPLRRVSYRELGALRDVSFDVHKGEFFGIVGRNGSGKSTLLKILASIYRADSGRVRIAGRLAPFIELGVGFNPDLSARENVVLNGVMMGLTPREARRRLDSVFDFAELDDFREMKLKNFSSGMVVRLAFSVMLEADSDILLVDEVLAVGDAAFQQKCADSFREMREAGKTVILVTHDMGAIDTYCDRAMLLRHGELDLIGDPHAVARRYFRFNFDEGERLETAEGAASLDLHAEMVEARLERSDGTLTEELEVGEPISFVARIAARKDLISASFGFNCTTQHGVHVFSTRYEPAGDGELSGDVRAGEQVTLRGRVDNPLLPGSYSLIAWVGRRSKDGEPVLQALKFLDFEIVGEAPDGPALVGVESRIDAEVNAGGDDELP